MSNRRYIQLLTATSVIALAVLLSAATSVISANGDEDHDEKVVSIPDKPDLTYPNLGSKLDRLATSVEKEQVASEDAASDTAVHLEESVAVSIHLSSNVEDVVSFLEDNGGDPRNVGENYIEAYVPATLLGSLSEQDGVERVREIIPPESTHGNYTSEGVAAHLATAWHDKGYRGQGIKVGIIDNGFEGFSDLMGQELPTTVKARCYISIGESSSSLEDCEKDTLHGTASAENVMDMAPEVSLYIANWSSYYDAMATVEWMISEGVSVINRSLGGSFLGPGDGTSPYRISHFHIIDRAVDGGIVFLNSAGNNASESWFKDGTPSIHNPDGVDFGYIEFAEDDITNSVGYYDEDIDTQRLPEGREVWGYLRWEDSWTNASTDLDLYLVDSNSDEIIARAEDSQTGVRWDFPIESFHAEIPKDGEYHLEIVYRGGELPGWIQLVAPKMSLLEHRTEGYSINGPSESANPGMLTVGATHYWDTHTIAEYSSRGPTIDGRIKPDIVGAACGETASYESYIRDGNPCSYGGTSSASPHVAGLAALVKQRFSDYTPEQIASYLKRNAEQREEPDPNNTWGHGLAVLPAPEPPIAPVMLPRGDDSNGPNWLHFTWEMSPTGREPVTSCAYHLEQQADGEGQADEVWNTHSRGIIEVSSSGTASPPLHTTITGLLAEQVYRFSISSTNIWGEGPYSEPEIRETTAAVPPSSPLGLTVEPSEDEENAVVLKWQAPEDNGGAHVSGYVVQAAIDPEEEWLDGIMTESTETTYTDYWNDDNGPAFESGQSPYYRVAAINSAGTGPFSGEVTTGDPLLLRYDTNRNGVIEKAEVVAAINDYLFGDGSISKEDVVKLINMYLFGGLG